MNLLQTIQIIERTAAEQPLVGTVVRNDVFRLNASPVVRYGAFAWLQNEHSTSEDSGLITFNFTFFYVDRLLADKSNEVQIQSQGIETLENILHALAGKGLFAGSYTYRTFNQRFADECAGVFCNVTLETAKDTLCAEAYEYLQNVADFNLDYNEDFKVWEWRTEERTVYFI